MEAPTEHMETDSTPTPVDDGPSNVISADEADKHITFERDANTIICGPTSSGKSTLMQRILLDGKFAPHPYQRVIICAPAETCKSWREILKDIEELRNKVTYVEGASKFVELIDSNFLPADSVLILDDYTQQADEKKFRSALERLFHVTTHHKHLWTFFLIHNLFTSGVVSARRNTQNFILFNTMGDHAAAAAFASRLVNADKAQLFMDMWKDFTAGDKHGWMRFDQRLRGSMRGILSSGPGVTIEDGAKLVINDNGVPFTL